MKYFGEGLSEEHKALNKVIRKKQSTKEAINIFMDIHKQLHRWNIKDRDENQTDRLFGDLEPREYAIMPGKDGRDLSKGFCMAAGVLENQGCSRTSADAANPP